MVGWGFNRSYFFGVKVRIRMWVWIRVLLNMGNVRVVVSAVVEVQVWLVSPVKVWPKWV